MKKLLLALLLPTIVCAQDPITAILSSVNVGTLTALSIPTLNNSIFYMVGTAQNLPCSVNQKTTDRIRPLLEKYGVKNPESIAIYEFEGLSEVALTFEDRFETGILVSPKIMLLDDAAFEGIILHEIAHIKLHHIKKKIGATALFSVGLAVASHALVQRYGATALTSVYGTLNNSFLAMPKLISFISFVVTSTVNNALILKYFRTTEREADNYVLQHADLTVIEGLISYLKHHEQTKKHMYRGICGSTFAAHPHPSERIQYLEAGYQKRFTFNQA